MQKKRTRTKVVHHVIARLVPVPYATSLDGLTEDMMFFQENMPECPCCEGPTQISRPCQCGPIPEGRMMRAEVVFFDHVRGVVFGQCAECGDVNWVVKVASRADHKASTAIPEAFLAG